MKYDLMSKLVERRCIKKTLMADALNISKPLLSYKLKHNSFDLFDIKTLRQSGVINLEDIDVLTR